MQHFLSFDIEHGVQTFKERGVPFLNYPPKGEIEFLESLINKLSQLNYSATFFVLTSELHNYEKVLFKALEHGHEIASHGHEHIRLNKRSPNEFTNDIDKSRKILQDVFQVEVKGYRAPGFSLNYETKWAIELIGKAGFTYSSSSNFDYKLKDSKPQILSKNISNLLENANLTEFPSTSISLFGRRQRVWGGFYSRVLPIEIQKPLIQHIKKIKGPLNLYLHPFEFDLQAPQTRDASFYLRFLRYHGIESMEEKLDEYLRLYSFKSFGSNFGTD